MHRMSRIHSVFIIGSMDNFSFPLRRLYFENKYDYFSLVPFLLILLALPLGFGNSCLSPLCQVNQIPLLCPHFLLHLVLCDEMSRCLIYVWSLMSRCLACIHPSCTHLRLSLEIHALNLCTSTSIAVVFIYVLCRGSSSPKLVSSRQRLDCWLLYYDITNASVLLP